MVCIDLYHSRLLSFIKISIKAYPTAVKCTYYVRKLDNFWWNLVKFCQMTWKSVANTIVHNIFEGIYQNFNLFLAKYGNFTMSKVEWVEISEISLISSSSLMTLTRLILVGLLFDLFYRNFDKIYQSVSYNQLQYINNRTYKHRFSTK